jgi:hypothetical protein
MANFPAFSQHRFFAKKFGKVKKSSGEEGGKTEAETEEIAHVERASPVAAT